MSVISLDMIRSFAKFHEISLDDGSQYPGVVGTLTEWEAGRGELMTDSELFQDPVFKPLIDAHFAACKPSTESDSKLTTGEAEAT